MSASPEAQDTIGNYVIERPLASGSMGHVYVARHSLTYARVALKVLREDLAADAQAEERFLREIRAAAQIGHDGIVKVHDAGRTKDGRLYLAMELLNGETLEDRIDREAGQRLSIMDWLLRALAPLAAAHEQGIIHRDLKPANVFITRAADGGEQIKLLDFGLARDTRQKSGTETGITLGTPHYMSPEQATRPKLVGPATDVWSMGVMMYEVLSGHMPFDGETLHAVVIKAAMHPHMPLAEREPTLDARLCGLVEECLSKDPSTRPADAGQLLLRLQPLLHDEHLRHELLDPVERVSPMEGAGGLTPEQVPYADTISGLPLRLFDDARESRIPRAPKRGSRTGLWLSTFALGAIAVGGFVWLLDRADQGKPTAQDVVAAPTQTQVQQVAPPPTAAPVQTATRERNNSAAQRTAKRPATRVQPAAAEPRATKTDADKPEASAEQIAKDVIEHVQGSDISRMGSNLGKEAALDPDATHNAAPEPAPETSIPGAVQTPAVEPVPLPAPFELQPQDPGSIAPLPELPEPPDPGTSAP